MIELIGNWRVWELVCYTIATMWFELRALVCVYPCSDVISRYNILCCINLKIYTTFSFAPVCCLKKNGINLNLETKIDIEELSTLLAASPLTEIIKCHFQQNQNNFRVKSTLTNNWYLDLVYHINVSPLHFCFYSELFTT